MEHSYLYLIVDWKDVAKISGTIHRAKTNFKDAKFCRDKWSELSRKGTVNKQENCYSTVDVIVSSRLSNFFLLKHLFIYIIKAICVMYFYYVLKVVIEI